MFTEVAEDGMNEAVGIRVLLTDGEIMRLLKLLDAAIFGGSDTAALDRALEAKFEGAMMEAGPSPE